MAFEIPRDRPITDDELEAAIIQVLLNPGSYQPGIQGAREVIARFGGRDVRGQGAIIENNGGSDALDLRFLSIVWRWVGVGLLVPRGPSFHLAPGARELFEQRADEAEIVLHRSGLVRRLRERCPNLDSVTERYAGFAQDSFSAGHYQAAAVMIGVASEAALLYFVPRCQAWLTAQGAHPRRLSNSNAVTLVEWVDAVVRQHRRELVQAVLEAGRENWIDDIPGLLGIGTGIRLTRNEAGHPTPHVASRDDCWNMLGLFPRLAEALFVTADSLGQRM